MGNTLLLIDDSVVIHRVVEIAFGSEDINIQTTINGSEALSKLIAIKPNIILIDISLPDLDGYEVCKKIRAIPEYYETPILFLAEAYEAFDPNQANAAGSTEFIQKPFEVNVLTKKVQDLLLKASKPETLAESETIPIDLDSSLSNALPQSAPLKPTSPDEREDTLDIFEIDPSSLAYPPGKDIAISPSPPPTPAEQEIAEQLIEKAQTPANGEIYSFDTDSKEIAADIPAIEELETESVGFDNAKTDYPSDNDNDSDNDYGLDEDIDDSDDTSDQPTPTNASQLINGNAGKPVFDDTPDTEDEPAPKDHAASQNDFPSKTIDPADIPIATSPKIWTYNEQELLKTDIKTECLQETMKLLTHFVENDVQNDIQNAIRITINDLKEELKKTAETQIKESIIREIETTILNPHIRKQTDELAEMKTTLREELTPQVNDSPPPKPPCLDEKQINEIQEKVKDNCLKALDNTIQAKVDHVLGQTADASKTQIEKLEAAVHKATDDKIDRLLEKIKGTVFPNLLETSLTEKFAANTEKLDQRLSDYSRSIEDDLFPDLIAKAIDSNIFGMDKISAEIKKNMPDLEPLIKQSLIEISGEKIEKITAKLIPEIARLVITEEIKRLTEDELNI